jgi:hypothetical protein
MEEKYEWHYQIYKCYCKENIICNYCKNQMPSNHLQWLEKSKEYYRCIKDRTDMIYIIYVEDYESSDIYAIYSNPEEAYQYFIKLAEKNKGTRNEPSLLCIVCNKELTDTIII